jgi:hypothetical protein
MTLVTTALERSQAKARAGEASESATEELKLRRDQIWMKDSSRSRREAP